MVSSDLCEMEIVVTVLPNSFYYQLNGYYCQLFFFIYVKRVGSKFPRVCSAIDQRCQNVPFFVLTTI